MKSRKASKTKVAEETASAIPVHRIELPYPPPHAMEEMASAETDRRVLQDYLGTIRILRDEKNFSFQEIADWLTETGLATDKNAVYRAYTKHLSDYDLAMLERERQDDEIDEARS